MLGKVYDVLGFFSPFTIKAKMMLRTLWQAQLGWDTLISETNATEWKQWISHFEIVASHSIDRCYID